MAEMARSRAEPSWAESEMDRAERQVRWGRFIDDDIDERPTNEHENEIKV